MSENQPVAEALRAEIIKLATDGDPKKDNELTADVLLRIMRVAKTGRDVLMSLSVNPSNLAGMIKRPNSPFQMAYPMSGENMMMDDGQSDQSTGPMPYAMASPNENFGMTALREIIAAAKNHMNGGTSPAKLVEALVIARENGLHDVAKELEGQLGVGKEKPVTETAKPTEKGESK